MNFEYDQSKSKANLEKHGIDFEEGQQLWNDRGYVQFLIRCRGEERHGVLARYGGSTWLAVITYRGSRTRIISIRRATAKEVSIYDKANNR